MLETFYVHELFRVYKATIHLTLLKISGLHVAMVLLPDSMYLHV